MREKYWEGQELSGRRHLRQDPLPFSCCRQSIAYGMSEFGLLRGLRGAPVDVVRGDITGLPIPATAESPSKARCRRPRSKCTMEGPVREWPGYYAHGAANEPVIPGKKTLLSPQPDSCAERRR